MNRPGLAWAAVALAVVVPAACVGVVRQPMLSWLTLWPAHGWAKFRWWMLWSPAWAHASALHLQFNLLAGVLVGLLGWGLRAPPWAALGWLLAWPLTHALLMLDPRLLWYVGASGMLHAGVAVLVIVLWDQHRRAMATTVAAILTAKVLLDVLSGLPVASRAGLDIPVAPISHLFGASAGLVIAGFHHGLISWRRRI